MNTDRNLILEEHHEIARLSQELTAAGDVRGFRAALEPLLQLLQRHFQREEQEFEGLHASILRHTPQHDAAILELRKEHRFLLDRAHELRERAGSGELEHAKLASLADTLLQHLRDHEMRETHLFLDSIWTDEGGGD